MFVNISWVFADFKQILEIQAQYLWVTWMPSIILIALTTYSYIWYRNEDEVEFISYDSIPKLMCSYSNALKCCTRRIIESKIDKNNKYNE